jgi:hypothetical protein
MFPNDITNPAAYDAWVEERFERSEKFCEDCGSHMDLDSERMAGVCSLCGEFRRDEAARRRNIALTIDRDREDRARRGLPASRMDASLAANVHDAIDRKPSLGAMLRIADQREDEWALGKLMRDMEQTK